MDTLLSVPVAVKPVRRTTRQLYRPIDIHSQAPAWPDSMPHLSEKRAKHAARLLWRRFYWTRWYEERGRKLPVNRQRTPKVEVTSGNRYNWYRHGKLIVNPSSGWKRLVHELSHDFHRRLRPHDKPHSDNHRHLEKEMIAHVVKSGWLDDTSEPPPKPRKRQPGVYDLPVSVARAVDKYADRIDEARIERDEWDGPRKPYSIWIDLKQGWINPSTETHSIHEPRHCARDVIAQLTEVEPCEGDGCRD